MSGGKMAASSKHADSSSAGIDHDTGPVEQPKTTLLMIVFSFVIGLSSWMVNFDAGYNGVSLLMPPFNKAFGSCQMVPDEQTGALVERCILTATQQSLTIVPLLFGTLGSILSGLTGNYIGRRGTIQVGCLFIVIGAAGMLRTAGSFRNYIVCKCINGVGLGMILSASPVYGVECTAPQKRGMLVSLFNVGFAGGNATAAAVCLASASLGNNWEWQTPILCQIPLALSVVIGIMCFPESPRWYLVRNKEEKARKAFARFYGKDPKSYAITWQVQEVQRYIELEKTLSRTTSWTEIFKAKDLQRTMISVLILAGNALTGINFVAPFVALFLSGLGINNPYLINVIIGLCILAGAPLGLPLIEYAGRRITFLVGYSVMAICMLIFSSISTSLGPSSRVSKNDLVAYLCIWAFVFGGFVGGGTWVAASEMHSLRLRTYGQAFSIGTYNTLVFAASFWTPYMINPGYGNMGTNVGYFYFGLTIVVLALVFAFVPETARLSLEQIDNYFESGRPAWRTSIGRNKAIANGTVVEDRLIGESTQWAARMGSFVSRTVVRIEEVGHASSKKE
jgi:SP family sugar:H+ symporter-like MFS transporter